MINGNLIGFGMFVVAAVLIAAGKFVLKLPDAPVISTTFDMTTTPPSMKAYPRLEGYPGPAGFRQISSRLNDKDVAAGVDRTSDQGAATSPARSG